MKSENNFKINDDATLTNQCASSSYGIPMLCWSNGREYGPADYMKDPQPLAEVWPMTAADIVNQWGGETSRTEAERDAARDFLRQWPEGPQID